MFGRAPVQAGLLHLLTLVLRLFSGAVVSAVELYGLALLRRGF